jgi:SAM-dependent methyltransferase
MRDYKRFNGYLSELSADVYAQPPDEFHYAWGCLAITALTAIVEGAKSVLDVGCGQAPFAALFQAKGMEWTGVTIGQDFEEARKVHPNVHHADMTFLPFADGMFDLAFARHALEHSPFPVITLMELRRVTRGHLMLVLPAPEFWTVRGKNHYSVLPLENWKWLCERAGWHPIHDRTLLTSDPEYYNHNPRGVGVRDETPQEVEYWLLCEVAERRVE